MGIPRPRRSLTLTAIGAALVLVLGAVGTYAGWPGSITNTTNSLNSGTMVFSINGGGGTCSLAVRAALPTTDPCLTAVIGRNPKNAVPSFGTPSPTSSNITITNSGNLAPSQLNAVLSIPSCGVAQFANAANAGNPLVIRGQTDYRKADKWGTTTAGYMATFGQGASMLSQSTPVLGGFSFGMWFKTSTDVGLMGLSLSPAKTQSTGSTASPVELWIDKTGHMRFQLAGTLGVVTAATTTSTFNDNAWHFVVLTASTLAGITTITAWVDNTTAANTAQTTSTTLLATGTGYWHVGWVDANAAAVANQPASVNFTGYAAGAFVRNAATSSIEFGALQSSATAAAYKANVLALNSIDSVWMLDDDGTTTWNTYVPAVSSTILPCDMANITWTSAVPALNIAPTARTLTSLYGTYALPAPANGSPQVATQTLVENASYVPNATGLLLFLPTTYTLTSAPGTGWSATFRWMASAATQAFTPGGGLSLQ